MQTLPHSTASQDVSTQMGARPASSFSLDAAVQTLLRCTVSHDTSTQLPLTEFLIGCIFSNDPFDREGTSSAQGDTGSASPPQPPDDRDGHVRTVDPRVLLQPPPSLEQYAPGYVQLSQSRPHSLLFVPSMWEHILFAQLLLAREVLVPPQREPTILLVPILEQGLAHFLNFEPSFFVWSTLVNPNLMGTVTLIQPTVISCIINIVFLSSSGIQARRAEILLTLSQLPVVSFMQLFFKKPAITFRTSLSSSLCAPATRTLLSCSIKTPLSLTQESSHTRLTPQAKVRGVWFYSSFEVPCDVHLFLDHRLLHFAQYTFTMSCLRNVMHPLSSSSAFMVMREHHVDFIGGDLNMSAFCTVGDVFSDAEFSAPVGTWCTGGAES